MSFLNIDHFSFSYHNQSVFHDMSFSVESGIVSGILGANGSGKTTLLNCLSGALFHEGKCSIQMDPGETILPMSSKDVLSGISYMTQSPEILSELSVFDVVMMGFNRQLKLFERPSFDMILQAKEMLHKVGLNLTDYNCLYSTLSKGQKQLCILARTLITNADILLMDEPESSMDFPHRTYLFQLLNQWVHDDPERRILITTLHDPIFALNYCQALYLLGNKNILGVLHPQQDSVEEMSLKLSLIYGPLEVINCSKENAKRKLVIFQEEKT